MAHMITMNGARAEMAFVGETPWHGLGQKLAEGQGIETWQEAAGMNWKVQRAKVRFATAADGAGMQTWEDQHVLFRSDTKAPLGIVSDSYEVVQPRAVLEFFRDLTTEAGFVLDTAGTLNGGRRFWALARMPEASITPTPGDRIQGRVLLATSADGTMRTTCKTVAERVVCANTLAVAMGERNARGLVSVSHRSVFDAAAVKAQMAESVEAFVAFGRQAQLLALAPVSREDVDTFIRNLTATEAKSDPKMVRESKAYREILGLFLRNGRGAEQQGVAGTAWGLLNAATEYYDHKAPARSVNNRLQSAWFGVGEEKKAKAFTAALALAQ